MKKNFRFALLTAVLFLIPLQNYAQAFEKGANYITLGFGLDPYGKAPRYEEGNGYKNTSFGPIILAYEHGITEKLGIGRIGLGGAVAQSFYTNKSYHKKNYYEYRSNRARTTIAFRAAYHFDFGVDKLDVYVGIGGALHIITDTYSTDNPFDPTYGYKRKSISGGPSVYGGVRFLFTNHFGMYVEAGYDISALNGGFVFKF